MSKRLIWTSLCIALASCQSNHKSSGEAVDVQYKGDTIVVSENSPVLEQIVARKFQLEDFSAEFKTVGTVRPVSGKLAEIASPFAGRIVQSFVQLGQKVSAGSPVFELGSPEFYEATKVYFAAQSAAELAQRNYNRLEELAANGVASQKDLEQARSEAEIAGKEFEQARATLQIFQIDASSVQMGQPLRVVSPISGEIVKYHITLGSYAKEDAEPLAVVADLSHVWVAALVKEKYFGSIRHGDRVEVFTDAHPDKVIWGTIYYIGEMLDEETRSLEVIVECNNANRDLKLGMFCEVHFQSSPSKAIILPSTAIMQEQDNDYVLIEASQGRYVRRKVESETVGTDRARITEGIAEGEKVVVEGGIFLNM
ncbi:MAG: efflux RND transporter periplasmic adaptor subunit [Tannerellaceae bacterium]|jgi:cobalt-zinc-cadmium efflux system membrane fusion protein|nr:efflux RND transporter periplasmic adaptor subunit [Tannerellaceae bacterium]